MTRRGARSLHALRATALVLLLVAAFGVGLRPAVADHRVRTSYEQPAGTIAARKLPVRFVITSTCDLGSPTADAHAYVGPPWVAAAAQARVATSCGEMEAELRVWSPQPGTGYHDYYVLGASVIEKRPGRWRATVTVPRKLVRAGTTLVLQPVARQMRCDTGASAVFVLGCLPGAAGPVTCHPTSSVGQKYYLPVRGD